MKIIYYNLLNSARELKRKCGSRDKVKGWSMTNTFPPKGGKD